LTEIVSLVAVRVGALFVSAANTRFIILEQRRRRSKIKLSSETAKETSEGSNKDDGEDDERTTRETDTFDQHRRWLLIYTNVLDMNMLKKMESL